MVNLNKKIFATTNPYNLIDGLWELLKLEIDDFEHTLVFLPSHRAIRFCQSMLAKKINHSFLLPNLVGIGTAEEDLETNVIDSQKELFITIKLLQQKSPNIPVKFLIPLAESLIKMLNTMIVEGIKCPDWDNFFEDINLSEHFKDKAKFFKIATDVLPEILYKDYDSIINAQSNINATKEWINKLDNYNRIIVCGSTASAPITSELIQAVFHHKNGKILLPGNVKNMSVEEMNLVLENQSEQHPYFGIFNLLKHLNLNPNDIELIDTGNSTTNSFLSNAFYSYGNKPENIDNINLNISNIECKDESITSKVISLITNETVKKNKSIGIICPDIGLIERIKYDFSIYGINADFSTGVSGLNTDIGKFCLMIAKAIKNKNNPVDILGLLKHKWTYFGETKQNHLKYVSKLEKDFFRNIYIIKNLSDLPLLLKNKEERDGKEYSEDFKNWINRLSKLFDVSNTSYFNQIITIFENLTVDKNSNQNEAIFNDESCEILLKIKETQTNIDEFLNGITIDDYVTILEQTLSKITIRESNPNATVFVMGTPEARMINTDVIILAGLNETIFPKLGFEHPWINRKMADSFGWPKNVRKVGLMALDFLTLSSAPEVYWVRSKKLGSTLINESRFLSRVKILLNQTKVLLKEDTSNIYLKSAEQIILPKFLNSDSQKCFISANPDLELRPKQISATNIELLRNNPYIFYIKNILKLYPLEQINKDIASYDFGNIIHNVMEHVNSDISKDELVDLFSKEALNYISDKSYLFGFWKKRFDKISNLMIEHLNDYKNYKSWIEYEGSLNTESGVKVTAKADRILQNNEETCIVDIKTGSAPSDNKIISFEKPQLGIEALIMYNEGYPNISKTSEISILIVQCQNGNMKQNKIVGKIKEIIDSTSKNLNEMLNYYNLNKNPYNYIPSDDKIYKQYDNFSRVKEFL